MSEIHLLQRREDGQSGNATVVKLTDDSGVFTIANVEAFFKVINACGFNNAYWFFCRRPHQRPGDQRLSRLMLLADVTQLSQEPAIELTRPSMVIFFLRPF